MDLITSTSLAKLERLEVIPEIMHNW